MGLTKNSGNHGGPRQATTVSRILRASGIGIKYQGASARHYTEVTNGIHKRANIYFRWPTPEDEESRIADVIEVLEEAGYTVERGEGMCSRHEGRHRSPYLHAWKAQPVSSESIEELISGAADLEFQRLMLGTWGVRVAGGRRNEWLVASHGSGEALRYQIDAGRRTPDANRVSPLARGLTSFEAVIEAIRKNIKAFPVDGEETGGAVSGTR